MSSVTQDPPSPNSRPGIDPSWLPIYAAVGIIALLFLPLIAFPAIALLAFGLILIRSAVVHRQQGWISGVLFGLLLLSPTFVGFTVIVVRVVRAWLRGAEP